MITSAEIDKVTEGDVVLTVTRADGRELSVVVTLTEGPDTRNDGAFVVFLDTPDWEPTPDALRVNVNDGPVFNYPDGTNHYGEDQGIAAPEATV